MKKKKQKDKYWLDDEEKRQRLINLLIKEIERILTDLETRRELLFKLWTKERVREPLLRVLHSRFYELGFETLVLLENEVYDSVHEFYQALDEFIFYVSYTEDMPQTLQITFTRFCIELEKKSKDALSLLKHA